MQDPNWSHIDQSPSDEQLRECASRLRETGEIQRAELIEVQCLLGKLSAFDVQRHALRQREFDLLAEHGGEWFSRIGNIVGHARYEIARGFLHGVTVTSPEEAERVLAECPGVKKIRFATGNALLRVKKVAPSITTARNLMEALSMACSWENPHVLGPDELQRMLQLPEFSRVEDLDLSVCGIDDEGLRMLMDTPNAKGLVALSLRQNAMTEQGLTALARAHFPRLRSFDIGYNLFKSDIGPLAQSPLLSTVQKLSLQCCHIGPHGLRQFLASPHLGNLTSLDLSYCDLRDEGLQILAESPLLSQLRELNVSKTFARDAGINALLRSPHLRALTSLGIGNSSVSRKVLSALTENEKLSELEQLDIGGWNLEDEGLSAVLRSSSLQKIVSLDIGCTKLRSSAARVLVESGRLDTLQELDLGLNELGDEGMRMLEGSNPSALRSLNLMSNHLTDEGLWSLSRSGARSLEELVLSDNAFTDDGMLAACSQPLPALRKICLDGNPIGDAGVNLLSRSSNLRRVTHLDLRECGLTAKSAQYLSESPHATQLRWLSLQDNEKIGNDGLSSIIRSKQLERLLSLDLGGCTMTNEILPELCASQRMRQLEKLNLNGNDFDTCDLINAMTRD